MTEALAAPVAAPAAAPAAPAAPAARPSIEQRASALKASLETSPGPAEPAAETSEVAEASVGDSGASPSAADSAGSGDDAAAKARAERLARIEQVRAKERAKDERRQESKRAKAEAGEVEKLRARLAEVEPLEQVFSSEEALLEMAEKRGMSAEKLVAWMRQRLTDPQAVAAQKAKSEADKVREEMAALKRQLEEEKAAAQKEAEAAKAHSESIQRAQTFVQQVATSTAHPLTSAFLKKHGPQGLVAFANHFLTPLLPEHYEISEMHDHFEQFLDEVGVNLAPTAPAATSPSTKNSGAAKPVTTLSNAMASERATAVEEIPLHKLSRDERARRLKDKLANE